MVLNMAGFTPTSATSTSPVARAGATAEAALNVTCSILMPCFSKKPSPLATYSPPFVGLALELPTFTVTSPPAPLAAGLAEADAGALAAGLAEAATLAAGLAEAAAAVLVAGVAAGVLPPHAASASALTASARKLHACMANSLKRSVLCHSEQSEEPSRLPPRRKVLRPAASG